MRSRSPSRIRKHAVGHESAGSPAARSLGQERARLIQAALSGLSLSVRDREILTRFYIDEQSPERICTDMGITETQFQAKKSRAVARFAALGQETPSPSKPATRELAATALQAAIAETTPVALLAIDRVVPAIARAIAVFGDEQKASHWLRTPLALLGQRSPAQFLAGGGDPDAIEVILTRIEHNIPS